MEGCRVWSLDTPKLRTDLRLSLLRSFYMEELLSDCGEVSSVSACPTLSEYESRNIVKQKFLKAPHMFSPRVHPKARKQKNSAHFTHILGPCWGTDTCASSSERWMPKATASLKCPQEQATGRALFSSLQDAAMWGSSTQSEGVRSVLLPKKFDHQPKISWTFCCAFIGDM